MLFHSWAAFYSVWEPSELEGVQIIAEASALWLTICECFQLLPFTTILFDTKLSVCLCDMNSYGKMNTVIQKDLQSRFGAVPFSDKSCHSGKVVFSG